MFSKPVLFAIFAAILCQLSQQKAIEGTLDYDGCKTDYQCFGLPSKCETKKSCTVLLKTQAKDTGDVEFELFWVRKTQTDSWVAAGLSTDQKMGDDSSTIFVVQPNQTVKAEQGLTFLRSGSAGVTPKQVSGIAMVSQKYANGLLTGKWTRAQKTTVEKLTFDMKANKYFIFLAYGPVKEGQIHHHSHAGLSDSAVNLEFKTKLAG